MVFPAVVSGFPVDSKPRAFRFLFLLPYPRDPQSLPACSPSSRGVSVSSLWPHSASRTGSLCPSLIFPSGPGEGGLRRKDLWSLLRKRQRI